MTIIYNQNTSYARTAKELLQKQPSLINKNGYYMIWPYGKDMPGHLVYCDMTTDGGGWMLTARSHPTTVTLNSNNWGWMGGKIGDVKDFTQAYQLGWGKNWHITGNKFTEMIFGNQYSNKGHDWGYFIYKKGNINYTSFMGDTAYTPTSGVVKTDISVYDRTTYPGMQNVMGFATTGTTNNIYFMRDMGSFSGHGAKPNGMITYYCGSDTTLGYSGPWCGGTTADVDGVYQSGTYLTAGGNRYGGTSQYMIMVR